MLFSLPSLLSLLKLPIVTFFLLWSGNFANMVMWGHTSLLYNYIMVETLDKTCQIDNKNLLKNYWVQ